MDRTFDTIYNRSGILAAHEPATLGYGAGTVLPAGNRPVSPHCLQAVRLNRACQTIGGKAMKTSLKSMQIALVFAAMFLFQTKAFSAEYEAMEGVESANAVFDFRVDDPKTARGHLDLIHTMRNDPNMMVNNQEPEIVVVFIGPSVNLIANGKADNGQNQQNELQAVADKISAMNEDGIRFEICMTTAHALDIDPDSILPEIDQVGNGWISVIGYQQQGYALVADF
jgi:uncharacterized protein